MAGFKGLDELVGRTISHVVVKGGSDAPRSQVMLVFSDDTVFEFYCSDSRIGGTWMLGRGGVVKARSYIPRNAVVEEHPAPGGT